MRPSLISTPCSRGQPGCTAGARRLHVSRCSSPGRQPGRSLQLGRPQWRPNRQLQHHQRWPGSRTATATAALLNGVEALLPLTLAPILKIGLVSAVGAGAKDLIDLAARRTLSKLAINVFTPALMISKLAPHIDLQHALALWPIGANVICCHLVGLAVGVAHTQLMPPPPHLTNIIRVTTAISNVGNLPLVMVMSLVQSPLLPFNTAADAERAVSYVMLGWFFATLIQMPLGHWLLHKPHAPAVAEPTAPPAGASVAEAGAQAEPAAAHSENAHQQQAAHLEQLRSAHQEAAACVVQRPAPSAPLGSRLPVVALAMLEEPAGPAAATRLSEESQLPLLAGQLTDPLAKLMVTHLQLPPVQLPLNSSRCVLESGGALSTNDSSASSSSSVGPQPVHHLWSSPLVEGLVSAPLIAGLVAIGIGSCPPLRDALFTPAGRLSVIKDCIDLLGQPLIPVLLLVLGSNLASGPGPGEVPVRSVLGVVASRLLLLPLLGCGLVLGAQRSGLISVDSLALVVMMVAWSTPSAILCHSLASVHRNGEDAVSSLLFYEYAAAAVTLPLASAAYLYLLGCCMSYAA